jgi:ribosomal protein S18 acetylase RimI-like enzyme
MLVGEDQDRLTTGSDLYTVCAQHMHLDSIVQIHLATFGGFFLETVGEKFLKELYLGFLAEQSGICLVAMHGKEVVGFVAGTTEPEGFFRRLLQRRWYAFVLAGSASLTQHPIRVGKKFLRALHYRGERPANVTNTTLLSSIGVVPSGRGRGIGKLLISAFCERAQLSGASSVFLTTDRDKNDVVNHFYISNRFKLHGSFLKERGRWMNTYVRYLANSSR